MNTDTYAVRAPAAGPAISDKNEGSYVDWAAIVAGGVIATAISVLLIGFGAGLGLSLTSPYQGEGVSASWVAIAAGIWLAWVIVTGFGAGGYVVGRMRRKAGDATADEVEARDGMHGLVVWATGLLFGALLTVMGVGSALTAGGNVVGQVAEVATEAASSDYFAGLMLRTGAGPTAPSDTVDPATGPDAGQIPAQPTQSIAPTPIDPSVQAQVAAIIGRTMTSGDMAQRDVDYLAQVIAANSNMDTAVARARVDEVNNEIAQVRAETLEAVEKARIAGIVFGFIATATLLLGAIAAFFAAAAGGRHRDEGLGFDITAHRH
jgi:ribosomal protein S28E/S33